jgi:hypothetical protein
MTPGTHHPPISGNAAIPPAVPVIQARKRAGGWPDLGSPVAHARVTLQKSPRPARVEKVAECRIFNELAHSWALPSGVLLDLALRGIESEPPIVLL